MPGGTIDLSDVSLYVICAILGNWCGESTINPGIWEGLEVADWHALGHGYGFGQWTNTNGDIYGRLWDFYDWMSSNNYDTWDPYGQIAYFIHENTWYQTEEAAGFSSLTEFLLSDSTDLRALTEAFCIGWEGIHDETWENRINYAYTIYSYIMEHANDPNINAWVISNMYLSFEERWNNAVLFYRYFASGAILPVPTPDYPPTPGPGGKTKNKMPVWMMIRYYNFRR